MIPRITSAAVGAALLLLVLAACSTPGQAAPTPRPTASAFSPEPSTEPATTPTPAAPASELTCESMISTGTVDALTTAGWTAEHKEFVIGEVTLAEGLLCFWADYAVASDHGQLYGWSAISPTDAAATQADLIASGWKREDAPEGIYITEDPQYSMGTDDEGYGMTYLFGDGWVKFADTKQGLILIEWTP
jgi:hypothetical protein